MSQFQRSNFFLQHSHLLGQKFPLFNAPSFHFPTYFTVIIIRGPSRYIKEWCGFLAFFWNFILTIKSEVLFLEVYIERILLKCGKLSKKDNQTILSAASLDASSKNSPSFARCDAFHNSWGAVSSLIPAFVANWLTKIDNN